MAIVAWAETASGSRVNRSRPPWPVGVPAVVDLTDVPAVQDDAVAGRHAGVVRGGDRAGQVDAGIIGQRRTTGERLVMARLSL